MECARLLFSGDRIERRLRVAQPASHRVVTHLGVSYLATDLRNNGAVFSARITETFSDCAAKFPGSRRAAMWRGPWEID
jgi:hypothetical protein